MPVSEGKPAGSGSSPSHPKTSRPASPSAHRQVSPRERPFDLNVQPPQSPMPHPPEEDARAISKSSPRGATSSPRQESTSQATAEPDGTGSEKWEQMKKLSGPFASALPDVPRRQSTPVSPGSTEVPARLQHLVTSARKPRARYIHTKPRGKLAPTEPHSPVRWSIPEFVGYSKANEALRLVPRPRLAKMTAHEQGYLGLRRGTPRLERWLKAEAADEPLDLSGVKPTQTAPLRLFKSDKQGGEVTAADQMPKWLLDARLAFEAEMDLARLIKVGDKRRFHYQWRKDFDLKPAPPIHPRRTKKAKEVMPTATSKGKEAKGKEKVGASAKMPVEILSDTGSSSSDN